MKTAKFNYETTTEYEKVWEWLKTQRVIGLSLCEPSNMGIFYKQDERGKILFMQRGYLYPHSHSTKEDFIECCKRDEWAFIVPNEAHTTGICLSQLTDRMSNEYTTKR